MSTTTSRPDYYDSPQRGMLSSSGAVFGASMLAIIGICQVLQGITAVADDKIYVTGIDYVYQFDVTAWGWIHIGIGVIAFAIACAIFADQTWGRIAGIGIAAAGAIMNFLFLPYYPFWSIVLIAFNVFVIWSLSYQLSAHRA